MELLPPDELDRQIARLLQGNDARPAAYSTSPVASQRLLRFLSETLAITAAIVEDAGVFYCRLRRSDATLSAGSAPTLELAIARAVANLSPATLGWPPPRSSPPAKPAEPAQPTVAVRRRQGPRTRPTTVPCEVCGAPMRPPPVGITRRHCNPCSYRLLMETARTPPRPSGS